MAFGACPERSGSATLPSAEEQRQLHSLHSHHFPKQMVRRPHRFSDDFSVFSTVVS